jgi:hypothetical protein
MKIKEKEIKKIIYEAVWFSNQGAPERCKGCGAYLWNEEKHDEDCEYGQLLTIVEKALKDEDTNI